MAYATRDHVYNLGLSAQAFVVRPRPFEAIDIATGTIRLAAHGFSALDLVMLTATSGGSLPTGVSGFTTYTPIIVSGDLFQLTGFASFASAGSGWGVSVDMGRRLDMHLDYAAAELDEDLTAHAPPIQVDPVTGLYPRILTLVNARMAARAMVSSLQFDNAAYKVAVDRLFATEEADDMRRADWKSGKPIQPRPVDLTEGPDNGARATNTRAAIAWNTGHL